VTVGVGRVGGWPPYGRMKLYDMSQLPRDAPMAHIVGIIDEGRRFS